MKTISLKKLRKAMESELNPKRYEHTLGVAYTAANLAMVHGADVRSAEVAGMLHDCAKCLPDKKLISICKKNSIDISEIELHNPSALLHSKAGSVLAHKKYGVNDEDILNAIKYHTTGRPNMGKLEKILYIADYIEPDRKHAPNLTQVRRMAYKDLDKALLKILEDTLSYLTSAGGKTGNAAGEHIVDPMTRETYEYYKNNISK